MQVVNSGARVQIPPSPFLGILSNTKNNKKVLTDTKNYGKIFKLVVTSENDLKQQKIKKLLTNADSCDKI